MQVQLWCLIHGRILGQNLQRLIPRNLKRKHLDSHRLLPLTTGTRLGRHVAAFWLCVADSGQVCSFGSLWTPGGQCCLVAERLKYWKVPIQDCLFPLFMHFWHKSSILKNDDLADGIHLENGPRESQPSETEGGEGGKEVEQGRTCTTISWACCEGARETRPWLSQGMGNEGFAKQEGWNGVCNRCLC